MLNDLRLTFQSNHLKMKMSAGEAHLWPVKVNWPPRGQLLQSQPLQAGDNLREAETHLNIAGDHWPVRKTTSTWLGRLKVINGGRVTRALPCSHSCRSWGMAEKASRGTAKPTQFSIIIIDHVIIVVTSLLTLTRPTSPTNRSRYVWICSCRCCQFTLRLHNSSTTTIQPTTWVNG